MYKKNDGGIHLNLKGGINLSLKQYLKSIAMGFDYDKYWDRRDKFFNSNIPRIVRQYYKFYLRRVDAKNSADINIIAEDGNNFKSHPILPHGIKGIIIAGGGTNWQQCDNITSGYNWTIEEFGTCNWRQCLYWSRGKNFWWHSNWK